MIAAAAVDAATLSPSPFGEAVAVAVVVGDVVVVALPLLLPLVTSGGCGLAVW